MISQEKTDRICIVDNGGRIGTYQGKELRFDASDRERAEMILFFVNRNCDGGPFRLLPLLEQ